MLPDRREVRQERREVECGFGGVGRGVGAGFLATNEAEEVGLGAREVSVGELDYSRGGLAGRRVRREMAYEARWLLQSRSLRHPAEGAGPAKRAS